MTTPGTERTRLCDRCLKELPEGRGVFYEVRVEIVADPTPPILDDQLEEQEIQRQYNDLVAELAEVSPRDAMEQVYRHRVWTLCIPCLEDWIESPFHAK